jgi:hypothetical protein
LPENQGSRQTLVAAGKTRDTLLDGADPDRAASFLKIFHPAK